MRKGVVLIAFLSVLLSTFNAPVGCQSLGLHSTGIRFPDGSFLSSAAGSWSNVLIVAKTGGHFSSIQSALDSIVDASETNPYLVWVAPGVYEEQVKMKSWVDIQGSGETVTRITTTGMVGAPADDYATLVGANNAELRFVTVEKSGPSNSVGYAVYIGRPSSCAKLTHITAVVFGSPEGFAIASFECSAPLRYVTGISREPALWTGPPPSSTLNTAMVLSSDGTTPLILEHVRATALGIGTGNATGMSIGGPFEMRDVAATASGGISNWGISIFGSGSSSDIPAQTLADVTATASGGTSSYGIELMGYTSPEMANVSSSGQGASTNNVGCYLWPYATATIEHSRLVGDDNMGLVLEDSNAYAAVAYSRVQGGSGGQTDQCDCLGAYSTPTCLLDVHCELPSDVICP